MHRAGPGEMTCPPGGRQRGQRQPARTAGGGQRQVAAAGRTRFLGFLKTDVGQCLLPGPRT